MKNIASIIRVIAVLVSVVFIGTAFSNDAHAQGVFQKRKHRKGFYVNLGGDRQTAKPEADTEANATEVEIKANPSLTVIEQSYELPFIAEELAYENVEFIAVEAENAEPAKIAEKPSFLGMDEKKDMSFVKSKVNQFDKLKQKLDPGSNAEHAELDPLLKKALIFFAAAMVIVVLGRFFTWWFVFGWVINFFLWLAFVVLMILACWYFIKWLMQQ